MSRIWIVGAVSVAVIAALKTYLVVHLAMPDAAYDWSMISGLFALFCALTATVAYVSFTQLHGLLKRQRREKLAPGASEPVAKETVVLRHAPEWKLSQAEADVAIFVVKGFSNSEIAEMRGCAIATVKSQLGRIYTKSGLEGRYQLIAFVTDEVCAMAQVGDRPKRQIETRNVLPLVGRTGTAA